MSTNPPTVGVVGAGQLARMMHQASIGLGVPMRYMAVSEDDPAAAVAPGSSIGSAMSDVDLGVFAKSCDVVTFDHEVVDLEGLGDIERGGAIIRPPVRTLQVVADKLGMRRAVEWAGLPVPPWKRVRTAGEASAALGEWGSLVLKPARGGYDGRGVFVVDETEDVAALVRRLTARSPMLLAEPLLSLDDELAVIVARRPGGEVVVYDPVRTLQIDGQCRQVTLAPSGIEAEVAEQARSIASRTADAIGVVGIMAVELFIVGGELVVNELAARPHNSGHHTIDTCVTSQFENHLRAVLDLPLGDADPVVPSAVMVNIVGSEASIDPRERLGAGLGVDGAAHIHLYGKQPRPNRKIGHVTVGDDDPDRAARRAWAVVAALGGDVPRELPR